MTKQVSDEKVKHPFLYRGVTFTNYSYIVLPYCGKSSLLDLLMYANSKKYRLSIELQRYLAKQIVQAIETLHNAGLAHLDIKPDNFMICDDLSVSLIDFGHTFDLHAPPSFTTGTKRY